mmetsp:Transcript_37913/g.83126  ORF Transcript_37913/g.83126 Transcript_37913/m.83126 type:complete len:167 (-) Transcript_37913:110-610(-)
MCISYGRYPDGQRDPGVGDAVGANGAGVIGARVGRKVVGRRDGDAVSALAGRNDGLDIMLGVLPGEVGVIGVLGALFPPPGAPLALSSTTIAVHSINQSSSERDWYRNRSRGKICFLVTTSIHCRADVVGVHDDANRIARMTVPVLAVIDLMVASRGMRIFSLKSY